MVPSDASDEAFARTLTVPTTHCCAIFYQHRCGHATTDHVCGTDAKSRLDLLGARREIERQARGTSGKLEDAEIWSRPLPKLNQNDNPRLRPLRHMRFFRDQEEEVEEDEELHSRSHTQRGECSKVILRHETNRTCASCRKRMALMAIYEWAKEMGTDWNQEIAEVDDPPVQTPDHPAWERRCYSEDGLKNWIVSQVRRMERERYESLESS